MEGYWRMICHTQSIQSVNTGLRSSEGQQQGTERAK